MPCPLSSVLRPQQPSEAPSTWGSDPRASVCPSGQVSALLGALGLRALAPLGGACRGGPVLRGKCSRIVTGRAPTRQHLQRGGCLCRLKAGCVARLFAFGHGLQPGGASNSPGALMAPREAAPSPSPPTCSGVASAVTLGLAGGTFPPSSAACGTVTREPGRGTGWVVTVLQQRTGPGQYT